MGTRQFQAVEKNSFVPIPLSIQRAERYNGPILIASFLADYGYNQGSENQIPGEDRLMRA